MFLDSTVRAEAQACERKLQDSEADTEQAHINRVATIGYLTASIVHDVMQPIAAMVANAHAALNWLDQPDVDEVREALSCILRDGARAAALVERTRDLVKKRPRRRRPVEINAAIREAIELIRTEAEKNGVSVQTKLVETLPPVSGDGVELQQVVLNLIINAIEAMTGTSEGPRELLVSTDRTEAGGVLISVRDSGPRLTPGTRKTSSRLSTPPSQTDLVWACRSAVRSSSSTVGACGRAPMRRAAPFFNLRCHPLLRGASFR